MMLFSRPFVALDFETTGLDPYSDRLLEIGAVKFDEVSENGSYCTLLDPDRMIEPRVTSINGISNDMVKGMPDEKTGLVKLIAFLEDAVIVAHNAEFDMGFFRAAASRAGVSLPEFLVIDTLLLSRKLFPERSSHALQKLGEDFKLSSGQAHRALDDARLCMQLFRVMAKKINFDWENPQSAIVFLKT